MLRKNLSKKLMAGLFILTMIMAVFAMPAMAATDYPMITMADSADFTLVKGYYEEEQMTVQGLDSSYVKHDFGADQQYVTWTSSNPWIVAFLDGDRNRNESISGTDTVTAQTMWSGTATITATYAPPNAEPVTVTSYVVVESHIVTPSVSGVNLDVQGDDIGNFTMSGLTVPLFNLQDAGIADNDNDVLKNTPTALHAFLYALELKFGYDGTDDITHPDWNWNWVADNTNVLLPAENEGAYLVKVGGDDSGADWARGWQFKVNSADPGHAASVTPLSSGNNVLWEFKTW